MAIETYIGMPPSNIVDWIMESSKTRVWWSDDLDDYNDYLIIDELERDSLSAYGTSFYNAVRVDIGYGVSIIGFNALHNCTKLTCISIPGSVTDVDIDAFRHTKIESIEFPDSVEYIGGAACEFCERLADVKFGSKLKRI